MIVVDTNVMARLVVGGEDGPEAAQLFEQDNEWAAPSLLLSELRNVLLGFVRRGAVTPEQAKALSDDASLILGDRIASVSGPLVIDTALECGLTVYDAEFVALARTLDVPLATLDVGLCHLAGNCGRGCVVAGTRELAQGTEMPLPRTRTNVRPWEHA